MKFRTFFTLLVAFFALVAIPMAQLVNPIDIIDSVKESTSWTDLITLETAIYTFLITVGGYVSAFIPGLNKIDSGVYRVLVWAILVIAGGAIIGFGNVWMGAISYFFSTSLYEIVLKWLVRSPKPSETK